MTDRTPCCVPGCRRTTAEPFHEWLCPIHWRLVSRAQKRVWARIRRIERRFGIEAVASIRHQRIWHRLKREAGVFDPPKIRP